MTSRLQDVAVLAAMLSISGCAFGRKPEPTIVTCGRAPSSYITDATGAPSVGIFTCYRTDGLVAYRAQALTAEEKANAVATLKAADELLGKSPADPCSDLKGAAYTKCNVLRKASKRAGHGLQPVGTP